MSRDKRLKYIPMYHEPKLQVVEVSSSVAKKPQPKKRSNKHSLKGFLESLAMLISFIGAFWAIFTVSCGQSKDDDPNDWYDCDGYGSY